MDNGEFKNLFNNRLEKVQIETDIVFRHHKGDFPPFLVNSAFYHLFGLDPDIIPDDYCTSPEVMTRFQEEAYYEQIKNVDDYFVPYLLPWMGTAVLSSALGSKVVYHKKADPAFDPRFFPVENAADVKKLGIADPDKDGLMPRVLECIRYMKKNSFLPVGITDCQGPLATANQLMGYDKFIFLIYENPLAAHELMDKITESLIVWIKRQKSEIGEDLSECFGDQQIYTGKNAGVWIADDDAVLIDAELYKQFVVPYNSRIFREFNNGILHYCGTANHQIENFFNTKGLIGINNYCLHDLKGVWELKKRIENKLVLILCDFTPLGYREYFKSLLESISYKGLILDSQYSSVLALTSDGKYMSVHCNQFTGRKEVFDFLNSLK
jgi:uroporphyrinogen-III decarboxylase